MSILIRGMEMPTDGEMLCINIYPDGKVCVDLDLDCNQIATAAPVPVPARGKMIIRDGEVIERDGSTDVRDYGKEIT